MKIEALDVSVRAGGRTILEPVSLTIDRPGVIGLIGPNGAGKSTLMRVLAGLHPPETGVVRYDGLTVDRIGRDVLGRRLAYLAQSGRVHWPLKVERVVALGRLPHRQRPGPAADCDRAAIEAAMRATHISDLRNRPASTLSGGERMRVLLARALAVDADVLLADEPIAALDPYHQLEVLDLLGDLAAQGKTVVVVLHDLSLAYRYCGRLILMSGGRMLADDAPGAVLTDTNLEQTYRVFAHRVRLAGEEHIVPWVRLGNVAPDEADQTGGTRPWKRT